MCIHGVMKVFDDNGYTTCHFHNRTWLKMLKTFCNTITFQELKQVFKRLLLLINSRHPYMSLTHI